MGNSFESLLSGFPTTRKSISEDYATLIDYGRQKATAVEPYMWDKSFKRHVPYKTPMRESRHWGRDKWSKLDSLPREFRDMVNSDPADPDSALEAAIELWRSVEQDALKAADRIIDYETAYRAMERLPEWLRGESARVIDMVRSLMHSRIAQAEALRAERERERREREERRRYQEERERRFYAGGTRSYYTTDTGRKLNEIEVIDARGLRPHEYRELLAKSDPLRFKKHTYEVAAGWYTVDRKKAEEIDNKAPDKIHPIHVARGRNY